MNTTNDDIFALFGVFWPICNLVIVHTQTEEFRNMKKYSNGLKIDGIDFNNGFTSSDV